MCQTSKWPISRTTINNVPGYSAQQSTLNTQGGFTLFIGMLVIGGFFQIQILQKVAADRRAQSHWRLQPGGGLGIDHPDHGGHHDRCCHRRGADLSVLTELSANRSDRFQRHHVQPLRIGLLLFIGPLGGLVSIRYAVRIEPLKALGLSS